MRVRVSVLMGALLLAFGFGVAASSQTMPIPAPANVITALPTLPAEGAHLIYTFDLHADIALRTFPWLKFHISGVGRHERNGDLLLHLNGMPWFAKAYQNVNMASVLEPAMWAKQYTIASAARHGASETLVLHDRSKTKLTDVRATVDDMSGVRELIWNYSYGGTIRLTIRHALVAGYALPSVMNVNARMPQYAATARATFTNYKVIESTTAPAQGSATDR